MSDAVEALPDSTTAAHFCLFGIECVPEGASEITVIPAPVSHGVLRTVEKCLPSPGPSS